MFNRRTALEPTTKLSYEALHPPLRQTAVIGSVFFFVRWFVGRFCRAVGQTHSLPSLGFSVGLCGLAMCVAVERWHLSILVRLQNFLHNLFCSKQCRTNLRLVLRAY